MCGSFSQTPEDRCPTRLTPVFVFQGSVLRGVPGRGEENQEVSGHQVHPKEGFKRQGKQHRERGRRPAKVSQIRGPRPSSSLLSSLTL